MADVIAVADAGVFVSRRARDEGREHGYYWITLHASGFRQVGYFGGSLQPGTWTVCGDSRFYASEEVGAVGERVR